MYHQQSLFDSPSAISSQDLESGPTPCAELDGPMIVRPGPHLVRASLTARQAKASGSLMSGICGQPSITSSPSAALQESLENRLRVKTQMLGSTLYKLTWKRWDMPSGRSRFRLRASVLRTSETERTGSLQMLAPWCTPSARDWKDTAGSERTRLDQLPRQAQLAGWSTPSANDTTGAEPLAQRMARNAGGLQLRDTATLLPPDRPARLTDFGDLLIGSSAGMESTAQLNPALPRWLQGLPPEWCACAVMAIQSMPRSRKSSSKP
jgi:hypothetical protein